MSYNSWNFFSVPHSIKIEKVIEHWELWNESLQYEAIRHFSSPFRRQEKWPSNMLWFIPILILKIDFFKLFLNQIIIFFCLFDEWFDCSFDLFTFLCVCVCLNWYLITIFKLIKFQQKIFIFFSFLCSLVQFQITDIERRNA